MRSLTLLTISAALVAGTPAGYTRLGTGFCDNGFYAGWDPADATLETCAAKCDAEPECRFFALMPGATCSRFNAAALSCNLPTHTANKMHTTYKKNALVEKGCVQAKLDDYCFAPFKGVTMHQPEDTPRYARWSHWGDQDGWEWRCCSERGKVWGEVLTGQGEGKYCMNDSGEIAPCPNPEVGNGGCYVVPGEKNNPKSGNLGQLAMDSVKLCKADKESQSTPAQTVPKNCCAVNEGGKTFHMCIAD